MKNWISVLKDLNKIQIYVDKFLENGEGKSAGMFRKILLLLWVNMLGFFVLSGADYFKVMNPLKLLNSVPIDTRKEITLYFPGSIEELHQKTGSAEKTRIVELHQKTTYNDDYNSPGREGRLVENAKMILGQLMVSPDSIRGITAIKDKLVIKAVWYFNDSLIVHLDKERISRMKPRQSEMMLTCIQKSLQANLGPFTDVKIIQQ